MRRGSNAFSLRFVDQTVCSRRSNEAEFPVAGEVTMRFRVANDVRRWIPFRPPPYVGGYVGSGLSACLLRLHPADGGADEFRRRFQGKFFFDVSAMDFDGLDAQMELRGDFTSAFPFADELEDFEFAVG